MDRLDKIEIEITDTGLIKITTDAISQANHANADQAIRFLQSLCGGEVQVARNPAKKHHHHHAQHTHVHHHH